ncbi:MAG: hydroxymethylglutaryl-CoA lyase [Burkholderiales bacterium]|nr:hydroxymethylglutaryl-CoA lyase [Burkholderiales bacterium]
MSDLPRRVRINEEGPREGFQIERNPIPTARKIELIDALSLTGVPQIQVVSFVSPSAVPGMADAEQVVAGFTRRTGVIYTGLWLNEKGLLRALAANKLDIRGSLALTASERFLLRNQKRTPDEDLAAQHSLIAMYRAHEVPVVRAGIMAAFGCNFEGDVPLARVLGLVDQIRKLSATYGLRLETLSLADTMAWATPAAIRRVVGAVREAHPELRLSLHLHDTRGMGIANAYAGLQMGVDTFDAAVGGLGGCPFAAHAGAAGNVCTEDLVFMCHEMGIETGIDLDALIEAARLAEDIVGHPLPGSMMRGGTLDRLRAKARAAAEAAAQA